MEAIFVDGEPRNDVKIRFGTPRSSPACAHSGEHEEAQRRQEHASPTIDRLVVGPDTTDEARWQQSADY